MRWRMLALVCLARVGLGIQFQTMASVGDPLSGAFGLDYAAIGLLIGLFMAPGLVLALPAGALGRFFSDRDLVVLGLGGLALGGVVSSLASGPWMLGFGRIIAGAGFLFGQLYFTKMIADWFDGKEIATAMSVLVMSWPFGIALGQVGHTWLEQAFGWQAPFQAASAYCAVFAVAIFAFYRPPAAALAAGAPRDARLTRQEWRLLVCAAGAWAVFNAGYIVFISFGPLMLQTVGTPALAAAGVISLGSWLMIGSSVLCGQLVDRFGHRDLVMVLCVIGAVVSLFLLTLPGGGLSGSIVMGLVGIAPAGVIMALAGQAMRPQVRAFGMGIFFTIYFAVQLATPPLAGALFDVTGDARAPMLLGAVLFSLTVPCTLTFRRLKSQDAASTAMASGA